VISSEPPPLFESLARSPDPVFVTDRANRIVLWNKSAERFLGFTEEDAVGLPCAGVLRGCDVWGNRYCSDACPVTQMAARGETVRHFDLELRGKDGLVRFANVTILNLPVPPPERYYLAHILQPSERREPAAAASESPPKEPLVSARESVDVRARRLTGREIEVLGMIAAGHMTPEIASRLHISALTVRNHVQNILEKLEVHSKAEAVAFAFQKRLL
jgi:DNA-binding CsgD family transcriptional regulator